MITRHIKDAIAELRRRGHDIGDPFVDAVGVLHVVVDDEPRTYAEVRQLLRTPEAFFVGVDGVMAEPISDSNSRGR